MELANNLRILIQSYKKKLVARKKRPVQWKVGLPDGLNLASLDEICHAHFGIKPAHILHQHLSGWKSSGAYRLLITAQSGSTYRLIFKDSIYSEDQIPALVNLPIRPGLPEYVMYSQPAGALAGYLPAVFHIEELEPGMHYRYVLEDLSEQYNRVHNYQDMLTAASLLPGLHQALSDWAAVSNTAGLLKYGHDLSLALQTYAYASLEKFSQFSNDPTLITVLKRWPEIASLHANPAFFTLQASLLIHGDSNFTNIHLHKSNRQRMKLVDWEWAGFGMPYADLASLMKGTPDYVERNAFQRFAGRADHPNPCLNPDLTETEMMRLYLWCQLERGLLDAAFLAAQSMNQQHTANFSLPQAVSQALARGLSAYHQLSN